MSNPINENKTEEKAPNENISRYEDMFEAMKEGFEALQNRMDRIERSSPRSVSKKNLLDDSYVMNDEIFKPNRRTSIYQNLFNHDDVVRTTPLPRVRVNRSESPNSQDSENSVKIPLPNVSNPTTMIVPQYTSTQPDYSHIKLHELKLYSALRFSDAINEYHHKYNIKLVVPTLIDQSARYVLQQIKGYPMSDPEFYALPNSEVLYMIQKAVRPKTKPEFVEALRHRIPVEFPPNYKPDTTNFRVLYDAYTKYRIMFSKKFDYMSYRNEKNVPECHDKDTGLIGLFLNGIDQFAYPRTTYTSRMSHDLKVTFKGPNGFENFLGAFYAILKKDLELHQQAKDLSISINLKTNDSLQISRSKIEPTPEKNVSPDLKKRPFIPYKSKNKLSALTGTRMSDENLMTYTEEEYYHTYDDEQTESYPHNELEENAPEGVNEVQDELFSLASDRPNACFALLFFNECKNQSKCKYDHSAAMLTKGHIFYSDLLNKSPYKPSFQPQNKKPQPSGIPRYSPKIQPRPQQKLQNVEEENTKEDFGKEEA
jgi:hypothetical protein